MHKTSIHVSLKEIWGETHSNPWNHTKNKGTKNKHEKDHEIHNDESSIQTRKGSQGLACRPSIHPFQQISHEALMLAWTRKWSRKCLGKMRNGREEMKP
jgi:hypothetical protein